MTRRDFLKAFPAIPVCAALTLSACGGDAAPPKPSTYYKLCLIIWPSKLKAYNLTSLDDIKTGIESYGAEVTSVTTKPWGDDSCVHITYEILANDKIVENIYNGMGKTNFITFNGYDENGTHLGQIIKDAFGSANHFD